MKIAFALAGFHRFDRGAEVALLNVSKCLAALGHEITIIGSGEERDGVPYRFLHASSRSREHFEAAPHFPFFRDETAYEELTFIPGLLRVMKPVEYDATITCAFPFTNFALRRPVFNGKRAKHIFVTQNGDWPAYARNAEYRFFGCDGLVCTNPDFFARNKDRWNCKLIPNGTDIGRFSASAPDRAAFGLPPDKPIALMVSALIKTKRVAEGIKAVSKVPNLHLVVAGDGPEREDVDGLANRILPGRYTRLTLSAHAMPALYHSADVFLHMSREEAFGNVYVEAMASGLPVVAPDTERVQWIVGDKQFLANTDDLDAIAVQINNALAITKPYSNSLKRAPQFSLDTVALQYEAFLSEVVGD